MAINPTGPLSLHLSNLQALVAACDAWQDWIELVTSAAAGSITSVEAAQRVHVCDYPAPSAGDGEARTKRELETIRPAAIVDFYDPRRPGMRKNGDPFDSKRVAIDTFHPGQSLLTLHFEDDGDPDDAAAGMPDVLYRFSNRVGAVIDEIKLKSGQDGYFVIDEIEILESFTRSDQTEEGVQGDRWAVCFLITSGL
jgi:hypothetical protein